jgi:hypothetical protein
MTERRTTVTTTSDAVPDGAQAPGRRPQAPDAVMEQLLWQLRGNRDPRFDRLPRLFHLPAKVCRAAFRWWARRHPERAAKYRRAAQKELCGRHLLVRRRIKRLTRDGLCAVSGEGKDRKVRLLLEASPALRERQAAMQRARGRRP